MTSTLGLRPLPALAAGRGKAHWKTDPTVIHEKDGELGEGHSHGNGPFPPAG